MIYDENIEEYYIEAVKEMEKVMNEKNDIGDIGYNIYTEAEETKQSPYKINYYLQNNLQIPYITSTLAKKRVQDAIIEFTGSFMDVHSKELSTSGPVYMIQFGDKEVQPIYDLFDITSDKCVELFDKMVEETYYGKITKFMSGWVYNAPHKLLLTAILIEALQKNYEDIVTCCEYLWAFSEYPIMYREFWKIGVKEDVMNYTIEHLSLKYKITKFNSIQELLKYDAHSAVANKSDLLKSGVDNAYMDFMYRMRNQIKNKFKNIANAYFDNIEKNASQHNKDSEFEDGSKVEQEGHATNISASVENTINKYNINGINNALLKIAADGSKVDKSTLESFMNQINNRKGNKMNKFIENIITIYFNKNPNATNIGSGQFLNFGLALYKSISTSKDPMYQEIRQILNLWLYDIINITESYQNKSTIISYTRAIFNYIILMIHYYN